MGRGRRSLEAAVDFARTAGLTESWARSSLNLGVLAYPNRRLRGGCRAAWMRRLRLGAEAQQTELQLIATYNLGHLARELGDSRASGRHLRAGDGARRADRALRDTDRRDRGSGALPGSRSATWAGASRLHRAVACRWWSDSRNGSRVASSSRRSRIQLAVHRGRSTEPSTVRGGRGARRGARRVRGELVDRRGRAPASEAAPEELHEVSSAVRRPSGGPR